MYFDPNMADGNALNTENTNHRGLGYDKKVPGKV